ncbi:hypothetical protein NDU88_006110 [Pleurodeles waltl]|uniref:Uncharacterized protein n=1 Tax=Pleurodeles waltl TaxID=8319 RepID=A0AAV7SNQ5_PLEWA|nr:hypothetical protein NDU88_006110 [Pleurodeles waltl]
MVCFSARWACRRTFVHPQGPILAQRWGRAADLGMVAACSAFASQAKHTDEAPDVKGGTRREEMRKMPCEWNDLPTGAVGDSQS